MKMHTSANFILRGGDAAFANRQRLLFDQLSVAESKCNKHDNSETNEEAEMMVEREKRPVPSDDRRQKRETKRFRGRESIFKRPEGPAPRANFRNIPDHHRNPHKWVRYSLDDVSSEDMTERSNTQAAMSFLRELKARKRKEDIDEREDDEEMDVEPCESSARGSTETRFKSKKRASSQIAFRKPQTKETTDDTGATIAEPNERPVFRSSKIILPEYVIGERPKRTTRKQNRPVVKVDRSKELRLDHLQEPDEEEDD